MTNLQRILNLVLLPLVVVVSFFFVKGMIAGKPEREVKKPQAVIPSVTFVDSTLTEIVPVITTFGNVQSYNEASLSAQVDGEVVKVDAAFNAGQIVNKGEVLIEIDPQDYVAILAEEEASLASAVQVLAEEEIRANLAAQDWIETGRELEDATDLTLRKPQLAAAAASVASARASLKKAQLDLESTVIRSPFDAIVQSRSTSLGNYVRTGDALGVLVAKDLAEVRLPLTPEQIRRIDLPMNGRSRHSDTGLIAVLTTPSQPSASWTATINRTEPTVDPQNQVIYVVGEIEEPFKETNAFLPIGAFVDARIEAKPIPEARSIPATALVEDRFVWAISSEEILYKQSVTRLLAEGDSLIVMTERATTEEPLKIATRPLASFREGQQVNPVLLDE